MIWCISISPQNTIGSVSLSELGKCKNIFRIIKVVGFFLSKTHQFVSAFKKKIRGTWEKKYSLYSNFLGELFGFRVDTTFSSVAVVGLIYPTRLYIKTVNWLWIECWQFYLNLWWKLAELSDTWTVFNGQKHVIWVLNIH